MAGLASLLGSLRYNSGVGWIFHGNKRHKMIQKYTKGPGNSCTSWGRLHLDQDILDPVEQDKADLSHHSPGSDQEAVPDSPHDGLWKITCVECQEPLNRIVFWADSMPHLQQENIGWWCIPNASSKSVLENCLKLEKLLSTHLSSSASVPTADRLTSPCQGCMNLWQKPLHKAIKLPEHYLQLLELWPDSHQKHRGNHLTRLDSTLFFLATKNNSNGTCTNLPRNVAEAGLVHSWTQQLRHLGKPISSFNAAAQHESELRPTPRQISGQTHKPRAPSGRSEPQQIRSLHYTCQTQEMLSMSIYSVVRLCGIRQFNVMHVVRASL